MSFFKEIKCESAEELMECLDPNYEYWKFNPAFPPAQHWLFRGHANACSKCWPLLPKAWREGENTIITQAREYFDKNAFLGKASRNIDSEGDRVEFLIDNAYTELTLLFYFIEMCNQRGLYVPDYQEVRDLMSDFLNSYTKAYLNINKIDAKLAFWRLDATAIAQHHGIPTRLLDWTYNGRKAAYFAIENQDENATHIAIYALKDSILLLSGKYKSPSDIRLVTAARYHNLFINAQEAVFTCDESGEHFYIQNGHFPSLEETLNSKYQMFTEQSVVYKVGYKLTLPIEEIENLRNLLVKEDIHRASLMPTYDNVAKQSLMNMGVQNLF